MMLLIDAGNTRIKWRVVEAGVLHAAGAVRTEEVAELFNAWRQLHLNGALVSCVADAETRSSLGRILASLGVVVHWLVPAREKHGLINLYDVPEKLGSDRYAALIAAARLRMGDCIVVSVGTATTVDMLSRKGEFLGGVIVPGPDLMRASLLGATGQVERCMQSQRVHSLFADNAALPRNTDTAVGMGIALAQAGVIHAVCERMPLSDARPPLLILSGGARDKVRGWLRLEMMEIEDLVLEGLAWIALEMAAPAR